MKRKYQKNASIKENITVVWVQSVCDGGMDDIL